MSMNSIKRFLVALLVLTGCFGLPYSRAQVLTGLQNDFAVYQRSNLREKIYLHTSKSFYLSGEILWFKVYCLDGNTHQLLDLSKVAYIDLLDNNGTAVIQIKVKLENGTGNGSIVLPFSLNNGNYRLRAYTNWMKNFGSSCYFQQQLSIVNALRPPATDLKPASSTFDVQFFPESGHLVAGINSKIALKAIGSDGKGVPCSGAVINGQNDTVARFNTLKFGIGSFSLTPAAGQTYQAKIKIAKLTITKELPQVYATGYVLHVSETDDSWHVSVTASETPATAYLLLHNDFSIGHAEKIELINGNSIIIIAKKDASEGTNYLTLFDDQKRAIAERLIFRQPGKKLSIQGKPDSSHYGVRRKVNIDLFTSDEKAKNQAANLSVAVYRDDSLKNSDEAHLAGYLWLRSVLKGEIESPDYYLENNGQESKEALDNLLLAQGWTQFDWSKTGPAFKYVPEYTGPLLQARITDAASHTQAKNIMAYLTVHGQPDQLYVAKSDSTGRVLFNTHPFFGRHEISVQTNTLQDSTYHIDVENTFDEHGTAAGKLPDLLISLNAKNALTENNLDMQVVNIFNADQIKTFYPPKVDSLAFYGKPTHTYLLENYTRFPTMEEVLREYVSSIAVTRHQGKFNIKMFNVDHLLGSPLVLVDGVPVFDNDQIFKVDPLKVNKLEMVSTNYLYGPAYFNGIMSFSTYKDDMANLQIDPHAVILDYEGLQQERKFYSPAYETTGELNSTIPDFRTTLYWDPKVETGTKGKSTLSFYTGDKPGRYIGIIEGISANGSAGSGYFTFEVKRK